MFDSLFIGNSGLVGHAKGLRVVSSNLANVNTPGYKSAQLQFADIFVENAQTGSGGSGGAFTSLGKGLNTLGNAVNFKAGNIQKTDIATHSYIEGDGFYTIKRGEEILYTRAGDFDFGSDGFFANASKDRVQAMDDNGKLVDISLSKLQTSEFGATTKFDVRGALSTDLKKDEEKKIDNAHLIDSEGIRHEFNIEFKYLGSNNKFKVTLVSDNLAGTFSGGEFEIGFPNSGGVSNTPPQTVTFNPPNSGKKIEFKIDFIHLKYSSGQTDLKTESNDGFAAGNLLSYTLESNGMFKLNYSNGKKIDGPRLILANFDSEHDLDQVGGGAFALKEGKNAIYGAANSLGFGKLVSGLREGSNVDLADEFTNLILMQRGYQASSHVISTTNEMIQQLFDMKGNR